MFKIMRQITKILVVFSTLTLANTFGYAQDSIADANQTESFQLLIPKLEVLIDSALVNNGMLGYRKDEIDVNKANLTSKRRNWTRNFGIQADTRYGNFNNLSNNANGVDVVTLASATTQTNYGVGLYLKIPVFDIFNRKSDIKQAKAEISQAENMVKL